MLRRVQTRATPQHEKILGSNQVPNSAGGFAWKVSDWRRLDRFLVLGTEGGTFYIGERQLTLDNAQALLRVIEADGARVVRRIVEISAAGRAPKNDPALFALALASAKGDPATRKAALEVLPKVARTGAHLLHFAQYVEGFRGWGRGLRTAVQTWYAQPVDRLAYQAVKYRQRDGWAQRDLLRLAHPKAPDEQHQALYHWIVKGWDWAGDEPHPDPALRLIWAFERIQRATSTAEAVQLIREYRLPREAVPTQFLAAPEVWEALLETEMPITALIRNLATLTRVGLLVPGGEASRRIVARLGDAGQLRAARIHPMAVLAALKTYAQGKGERGKSTWTPVPQVIDALDAAFYATFQYVEPTGKCWLLALDVSGSMGMGTVAGVPGLTPRVASAAMALITAATEQHHTFLGFAHQLIPLAISPRQRLDDVVAAISGIPFGGTDCALPMLWAIEHKAKVDVFVVYTDSETWFGKIHPMQALAQYREKMAIRAKLIVVGMTSN
ncbi:MAG: TROVE domain-containing protein, partial [Chloroflexi bacterium]|nr:TROVE domain-containing protein [Chloroflexota bacterium]